MARAARWYASKSRHVTSAEIEDVMTLADQPPIVIVLLQARFASGSHELYQLPLAFEERTDEHSDGVVAVPSGAGFGAIDAVAYPDYARELLRHINAQSEVETDAGRLRFHRVLASGWLKADAPVRPVGVEQSNSSIVFGDETVLKVFRKLEPGINPELELLRFLTARGFAASRRCRAGTSTRGGRSPPRSALPSTSSRTRAAAGSWRSIRPRAMPSCCWPSSGASARSPPSCTTRSPRTPVTRRSRPRSPARNRCRC